ncbi:velvet factor [Polychytrium aggregatum]|uniref:velvet factor n=1 Tax=Polychytrium aggregatum TaxID=110093 RepID=UPI0022FDCB3D|nr:velvet factor [Polychytrium aggregatum]KAI9208370.1 velvet factor [Polychytrium aggregatum]
MVITAAAAASLSACAVVVLSFVSLHPYSLAIKEQPRQVRASGYTLSISGRSVDPVPVLQLSYQDANGDLITDGQHPRLVASTNFVVYAKLFSADETPIASSRVRSSSDPSAERSNDRREQPIASGHGLIASPGQGSILIDELEEPDSGSSKGQASPLFGTLVSPSYLARGLDKIMGVFFIFGNLCVRIEGSFRLKFTLVDLKVADANPNPVVLTSVMSDVFESFSWRNFPGMAKISPLTKHLLDQGVVKIVRKAQPMRGGKGRKQSTESLDSS